MLRLFMSAEPAYQPSSRRPIADIFRLTAHAAVRFCVRAGISADAISYSSMIAAAGAGLCLLFAAEARWLLLVAPLFLYLRLWLNMLDGMVALASGKASLRGEILNEVPDRISDVLIFAAVAHSGLAGAVSGYWAALWALFTAYIGTFGQAVGVQREFSGWMSKQWRMVTLHLGCWLMFFLPSIGSRTVLEWTCWLVVAGCVQTVWIRLSRILRALERKKQVSTNLSK